MSENLLYPLPVFRFHVDFLEVRLDNSANPKDVALCSGAFSECAGLEATMEPKVIKEGGRNFGAAQRSGPVTFATVILKRGMTTTRDLWNWFELLTVKNKYAYRLDVNITMNDYQGEPTIVYKLSKALPIKFKAPDLSAKGENVIGIEEIHLTHEGLMLSRP